MERDLDPLRLSARAQDPEHAAARRLLPDADAWARVSQFAELATTILNIPHAYVALVTEVQTVVGAAGVSPAWLASQKDATESLCAKCAASGRPLVINDARDDPRVADLPAVTEQSDGSFCVVPMANDAGVTVGALCAWDSAPRIWVQGDVDNLLSIARAVLGALELAALTREFDVTRERWHLAIEGAGIGSFDWNLRTGQLVWDERLIEMFGYDGDERFDESIEAFNARLHPDDIARVALALNKAIENLADYEAEYRIVLPDGRIRQVQARGHAFADASGRAVRLSGAAWDVSTTRGEQNAASNVLEVMPVGHIAINAGWIVTAINAAAEKLFGCRRWDVIGRDVWQALPAMSGHASFDEALRSVRNERSSRRVEVRLSDPVDCWVEGRIFPDGDGIAVYLSDVDDRHLAQQLAFEMAEHDRAAAVALQEAMLSRLPEPDHVEIRARYLTAAAQDKVGGDWYDALIQPDRVTLLTVGDVSGHDINAAGYMGQLRSMLRAFSWADPASPAGNLSLLDHAMRDLRIPTWATCVTARIEQSPEQHAQGMHTLRWSNAGNLPPVVVTEDGTATLLARRPDLLLGVRPDTDRHEHTAQIPAGATVLLFTDGLVETRDFDLTERLDELLSFVHRHADEPLEQMLDSLLKAMVGARGEDDVVVLGARLHREELARPAEAGPRTD